ncbi:hypothetical protein RA8CHR_00777 [Variovorax sp. RA8]|nr:hypothetical protein RA8CHR_00777 [Variovorax sp. RA8]
MPPVFRVLQVTPMAGGFEYRTWTNQRSVILDGRECRFDQVGENTLKVPAAPSALYVVHGLLGPRWTDASGCAAQWVLPAGGIGAVLCPGSSVPLPCEAATAPA